MAHFAQLDENNVVINVLVVNNDDILDDNGVEQESIGIEFCKNLLGSDTRWVQTSYNSSFRHNYAVIGGTYDPTLDVFIYPKPFESWVLNNENYTWDAPVPYPTDGNYYQWNEADQQWDQVNV